MAAKPNYSNKNESAWVEQLVITAADRKALSAICADPLFTNGICEIAEHYRTSASIYKSLSTPGEDLATLERPAKGSRGVVT